ncbi:MAG: zinc transporter ZupT [Nitrospirae bacterium]|nr:MAG: zinc transporter ZupT [Nitrospirota bacterium]
MPLFVGMAIALAMLWTLPRTHRSLMMGFSIGVLLYLFFEVMHEAVEFTAANDFGTWLIFTVSLVVSFIGLVYLEQHLSGSEPRNPDGLFLVYMIALGLGLHNFGEGLAIGGSFAQGQWVLSSLLVGGFTLHNATEGFAIMAPAGRQHHRIKHIMLLGLLGGGPTCLGTLISGYFLSPYVSIAFYTMAAGSLLYVIVSLSALPSATAHRLHTATGITAGICMMFITGMILALLVGFRS